MNYKLVYTRRASKDIQKLEKSEKPLKYASALINSELGMYRFRIGDYRVIFDIDKENIVVLRVGHRKDIYRVL